LLGILLFAPALQAGTELYTLSKAKLSEKDNVTWVVKGQDSFENDTTKTFVAPAMANKITYRAPNHETKTFSTFADVKAYWKARGVTMGGLTFLLIELRFQSDAGVGSPTAITLTE
jgi:hypothetical protein